MLPIQDTIRGRNPPMAVYALVGLNVLVFALELTLPQDEVLELMGLFPQPVRRQASVEYLPKPRHLERLESRQGAS